MGFLCSSNQTVESTVETQLPDWITAASQGLIQKATDVANTGYIPYQGQRISDFTPDQMAAFQGIRNLQGYGQDALGTAMSGITDLEKAQAGQFDEAAAQQYMNPYISNVMDRARDRTFDAYDIARQKRDARATQAGAFGGDRQFIEEGQASGQMLDRLADQEAKGYAQAYDAASKIFSQDANRALAADKLNAMTALEGARGIGSLANLGQQMSLQQNQALQGVGAAQQQMGQTGLDLAYQDYTNQLNHPYKQLGFYSDILRGTPYGTTQVYSQPAPSPLSSIAGLGITGLGLYGMGGGFDGGFSWGNVGKGMFGGWN